MITVKVLGNNYGDVVIDHYEVPTFDQIKKRDKAKAAVLLAGAQQVEGADDNLMLFPYTFFVGSYFGWSNDLGGRGGTFCIVHTDEVWYESYEPKPRTEG